MIAQGIAPLPPCYLEESRSTSCRAMPDSEAICEVGAGNLPRGPGLFLPLFAGVGEQEWPPPLRAILYLMGLLWGFLGVAIIADVFMSAIESVTSVEKEVFVDVGHGEKRRFHVKVWNDTVANLTLMALGSSAPEILLSVIELLGNDFCSGELGPSTIVGSAAYNLFVIVGVCIVAVPSGQIRAIKDVSVFGVTTFASIFAYIWLYIILAVSTPNIVDVWEGVLTFLFFPLLVLMAYAADQGFFTRVFGGVHRTPINRIEELECDFQGVTKEEIAKMRHTLRSEYGKELPAETIAKLISKEKGFEQSPTKRSRAYYRCKAVRDITGGRALTTLEEPSAIPEEAPPSGSPQTTPRRPRKEPPTLDIETGAAAAAAADTGGSGAEMAWGSLFGSRVDLDSFISMEFGTPHAAFLECDGFAAVEVRRAGQLDGKATVAYYTKDGNAKAPKDYVAAEGVLTFEPRETDKIIQVPIIDNNDWEPDKRFTVHLKDPQTDHDDFVCRLGKLSKCTVTILNDDSPGVLDFESDTYRVVESQGAVELTVVRRNGTAGRITVDYMTKDDSAVSPQDYIGQSGTIVFEHEEHTKKIRIDVVNDEDYEKNERFRVILSNPSPAGVKFNKKSDGGEDRAVAVVYIDADPASKGAVDALAGMLYVNKHKVQLGTSDWYEQIKAAIWVNGSKEEQAEAGVMSWIMHIVALPWKIVFAIICPPTSIWNGWACFFLALALIGLCTALIGDLASLLGCVLGIPDSLTAITLVALGTSLPDTFASKIAAQQDPYADASIGNVTGSNSVNVFLGLGLPWTIGAVYWSILGPTDTWKRKYSKDYQKDIIDAYPEGGFAVPQKGLGFSVLVFTCCAVVCIAMLVVRRVFFKGELGGPPRPRYVTALFAVSLWLIYIVISTLDIIDVL
ncbi:unnamed protein product [Vitrella brassicaformis CCMP3155]|uniref:Calx-beta domain-containing protein n=2 Tax=Vitrella brassicaformis TaxID=1169539 RepID=A0A0G4FYT1_VITBC|nr:unnamed protein product [Vitrella brassicaformis CCMP3155]|eukprot:CEM20669.1 unnamed protein product [Vitrella brassicaformis CCMP3155]